MDGDAVDEAAAASSADGERPPQVFLSYAHDDSEFRRESRLTIAVTPPGHTSVSHVNSRNDGIAVAAR